jgi:integrase
MYPSSIKSVILVLTREVVRLRASEIFGLQRSDVMYGEGLLAVRAKLKGGKMRYVPMTPTLAMALKAVGEEDGLVFPLRAKAVGKRRRLEGSFEIC